MKLLLKQMDQCVSVCQNVTYAWLSYCSTRVWFVFVCGMSFHYIHKISNF